MRRVVVVRYSEIGLKGKNRKRFEKALLTNIESVTGWNVMWRWGRMYVDVDWDEEDVSILKRIFGIQNYSPAYLVPADFEAIEKASKDLVKREVALGSRTFKVNTKRASTDFQMGVYDVNRDLGAFVLREFSDSLKVDVHNPDFVLGVEIRDEEALIYTEKIRAYGGLPVGVSGRAVLMLSGGIDSPVAGWYAMKRGVLISALSFISLPYTSEDSKEKIVDIVKILKGFSGGHKIDLHFCNLTPVLEFITDNTPAKYWLVLQRRSMLRIAEKLAERVGAYVVYTGESVGQVASQTLPNISVIEEAVDIPVMRPLCGFDKVEIVNKAKEIGTYEVSIRPHLDVCSVFSPKRPSTKARLDIVKSIENDVWEELSEREKRAFEDLETIVV